MGLMAYSRHLWARISGGLSKRRYPPLVNILQTIAPTQLESLEESFAGRQLLDRAAQLLQVSRERVVRSVATFLDVEFLRRLPMIEADALPCTCKLEQFYGAGILPYCINGAVAAWVTYDPAVAVTMLREMKIAIPSIKIADPQTLDDAYAEATESHRMYEQQQRTAAVEAAHKAMHDVVVAAISQGADAVVIHHDEGLWYESTRRSRVVGKGVIHSTLLEKIKIWFEVHAGSRTTIVPGADPCKVSLGLGGYLGVVSHLPHPTEGVATASEGVSIEPVRTDLSVRQLLLVEDNPVIAKVLTKLLHQARYEVMHAPHGGVGLELCEHHGPFVAVVCDLMTPSVDGIEFVMRLRERGDATPVLIVTSAADEVNHIRSVKAGANAFLSKDASPELLLAYLQRVENLACFPYGASQHPMGREGVVRSDGGQIG